ncbi:MAG: 1,4-dihydroxy-2-naphthoate octaprenyltransferase [Muribaculaceae bacterium]|nr:1,4-dihydroxy-2-naphthoate octaprenyltransferase [Muribaculaceae bacterium]
MKRNPWIEAMRPHTLPVSTAGVVVAAGMAYLHGVFQWLPVIICFVFASLAQIVSNFANEYFDFVKGSDKKGREGFRRGVTEGDISPKSMLRATLFTLLAAGAVGCCLIPFGGWKLIPIGIIIAVFALAYSAGPLPLSRIGLGDIAVLVFFGLVPVCLTYYVQANTIPRDVVLMSLAVGLMGVNVLIVNNYRDVVDDRQAGKRTTVVLFGRRSAAVVYLLFGIAGIALSSSVWLLSTWMIIAPIIYFLLHSFTWWKIIHSEGAALNPLLGATARNMLVFSLLLVAEIIAFRMADEPTVTKLSDTIEIVETEISIADDSDLPYWENGILEMPQPIARPQYTHHSRINIPPFSLKRLSKSHLSNKISIVSRFVVVASHSNDCNNCDGKIRSAAYALHILRRLII